MAILDRKREAPAERGAVYLLMNSSSILLAQAELKGAPDAPNLQFYIVKGRPEDVVAAEVVQAIPSDVDLPVHLGRVILRRGRQIVLEPLRELGAEVRQNLRMPVDFESYVYPQGGGRAPIRAHDLSCGGIAFYTAWPFAPREIFEVVIPITEGGPLIVNAEILREKPGNGPEKLYASAFVNLIHDEEALIREAVFNVQLEYRDGDKLKGRG